VVVVMVVRIVVRGRREMFLFVVAGVVVDIVEREG
jgi:hypothetical protein